MSWTGQVLTGGQWPAYALRSTMLARADLRTLVDDATTWLDARATLADRTLVVGK